jgi:subtilisin family serine protease
LTRHPWVVPVVAVDGRGRPLDYSNLGAAIGRHGVGAPGEAIRSLGPAGSTLVAGGTSAAAPFVTGTLALLASLFPLATARDLRQALLPAARARGVVPALLDAQGAHRRLTSSSRN